MIEKGSLTFAGGTGTVTGANFLLEVKGKKILIDCGMEQGSEFADASNREPFPYNVSEIDFLLVTHAHIDHIGRIPKLVREGFKGVIYSSPATLELSHLMLPDAARLLEDDARKKGVLPLYEIRDVPAVFLNWQTIPYYNIKELAPGISVELKDSGHILGSVMFEITVNGEKIVFTGDLGNSPSLFLRDTDKITDAKYMVMESVYGDRNHESKESRKQKFTDALLDTIKRRRTLIIPAFSLERTQDILFEINEFVEHHKMGDIKVFIDSPLATNVTEVYERHTADFNQAAKALQSKGDNIFDFKKLRFTVQKHESDRLDHLEGPKVIIAGSGMSNGGRIVKHEKHFLPDPNATILLVGYQSLGTLGRKIQDGAKELMIDGEKVKVNAEVRMIFGYSSHRDSEHLVEFVADTAEKVKTVFVAMGEPKSGLFLVQRLRDYLGVNAVFPKKGDRVELEF